MQLKHIVIGVHAENIENAEQEIRSLVNKGNDWIIYKAENKKSRLHVHVVLKAVSDTLLSALREYGNVHCDDFHKSEIGTVMNYLLKD